MFLNVKFLISISYFFNKIYWFKFFIELLHRIYNFLDYRWFYMVIGREHKLFITQQENLEKYFRVVLIHLHVLI